MTDYDWKKFEKRITLNSLKPVVIYNAWATRDGIESWFLRESVYAKENGQERERTEPAEAVLQGGVDLRNKNVLIQKVVNA